jgi:hypothetical protein
MMFCSHCGTAIDVGATFCSKCGGAVGHPPAGGTQAAAPQPPAPSRKVGILLGIGIFVMPYIFSWFTLRKGHSTLARGLAFGWFVLVLIGLANNNAETSGSKSSGSAALAPDAPSMRAEAVPVAVQQTAPAKPAFEPIAEGCRQVADKFDASSKLSDLQKESLWEQYKGKQFEWKLRVVEVSSNMFGGYSVQFKCVPSRSLIQDVQISYPDSAREHVMQLEKDGVYVVRGKLKISSTLLGLSAEAI